MGAQGGFAGRELGPAVVQGLGAVRAQARRGVAVELPAGAVARVEEGDPQPQPGGGDGRGQPGRSGPDDGQVDRFRGAEGLGGIRR